VALSATKGNLINKGCNANAVRKANVVQCGIIGIGQLNSYLFSFSRFLYNILFTKLGKLGII
jgi:hypothetical protein